MGHVPVPLNISVKLSIFDTVQFAVMRVKASFDNVV